MMVNEANEIVKSYEGFHTMTVYPKCAWTVFVVGNRNKDDMVRYYKKQIRRNQVEETFKTQFYLCLAYAQDEARKCGKTVHDIKMFHGAIDPIYQCLNSLAIEWMNGSLTEHEYSLMSSKDMQYKQ